jgi:hypothetical protein
MAKEFVYRQRTKEQVSARANQKSGNFDSYFKDIHKVFVPKEGEYQLRFLPPTWEDPSHYGLDLFVHYGIGTDSQSYLCLASMKGEPCPICEERKRAERRGDAEYVKSLSPTKRVAVWLVDRDAEKDGPQIWAMPWTFDRDLALLSVDKASGEVICLDDPDEGYDFIFTRKGSSINTKYIGLQVARKPTPISDDDSGMTWISHVLKNPLPDTLVFYSYDHIAAVFSGGKPEERETAPKAERVTEAEEKPVARKRFSAALAGDSENAKPAAKSERAVEDDPKAAMRTALGSNPDAKKSGLFAHLDDDEVAMETENEQDDSPKNNRRRFGRDSEIPF